jgi:hypothetical protein
VLDLNAGRSACTLPVSGVWPGALSLLTTIRIRKAQSAKKFLRENVIEYLWRFAFVMQEKGKEYDGRRDKMKHEGDNR